jgi:hypothetical protein
MLNAEREALSPLPWPSGIAHWALGLVLAMDIVTRRATIAMV